MEKLLFIFIHIGIPVLTLFTVLFYKPRTRLGAIFTLLFLGLMLVFLYFWGQWPIVLSLYFKYVLGAIGVLAAISFLRNWKNTQPLFPRSFWGVTKTMLVALFSILMAVLTFQIIQGRSFGQPPVELAFPLKNGSFYVSSGGSNRVINNHFGTPNSSQWYALDLNKLGKWGMVSSPPLSARNAAHSIFGEQVYAPCNGLVIAAKNTVLDNTEASMQVSRADGMGNFIVLDCKGIIVSMSHLQHQSLKIRQGQSVRAGDPLGRVGNSGFSQEPHLHFQAARHTRDTILEGIPVQFNGYAPVRNDVIRN
jgi:hypothetical protein